MLRALLIVLFLFPFTAMGAVFGLAVASLAGSVAPLYRMARFGVRVALRLAGTQVELRGGERVPDPHNLVVVSNHVSHLDGPVLLLALGLDFRAIVKKEIMGWPFFGRILRFVGFVPVDRRDREQSARAVSATAESLKGGQCFLVFPEGTRSPTGELGEFKKGGFVAAIEAKSRILPVAISGTRELLPRGRFRVRPGRAFVHVLDPMDAGGYSYADRDRLVAAVRDRIARALAEAERVESGEPRSE